MKRDRIRFSAYLSPPQENVYPHLVNPNCITEAHYRTMTDCGFLHAIGLFEDQERYYKQAMAMAERCGVAYFVRDQFIGDSLEWVIDDCGKNGPPKELIARLSPRLVARFDTYCQSPAFAGILAADEPSRAKFEGIRAAQDWFLARYPDKEFEVNLLPNYANSEQLLGIPNTPYSYEEYLEAFMRIVEPRVLSFDFYALERDAEGRATIRPDHLRNLELVADASRRAGIPFHVFLLTMGHWNFRTVVKYGEIGWQLYTALAYGAAGAQTFTYWTLLGDHETDGSGITHGVVGQNGELTPTYYACKEAIAEVRSFERAYLGMRWLGAFGVTADEANPNPLLKPLRQQIPLPPGIAEIWASEDLIVGSFAGDGKSALLLSNLSDPEYGRTAEVRVKFKRAGSGTLYNAGVSGNAAWRGGEDIRFSIRSGGGAFLVLN